MLYVFALFSLMAVASTEQCPSLKGKFFCPARQGSHRDMIMTIAENKKDGKMNYLYTYAEGEDKPFSIAFITSDQGEINPDLENAIGRCQDGFFFLSGDGSMTEKTLLNTINPMGDYEVIIQKDRSSYLVCKRLE